MTIVDKAFDSLKAKIGKGIFPAIEQDIRAILEELAMNSATLAIEHYQKLNEGYETYTFGIDLEKVKHESKKD